MTTETQLDVSSYCQTLADHALSAGRGLAVLPGEKRNAVLRGIGDLLEAHVAEIVKANDDDLARSDELGLTQAMKDRLRLDETRIRKMAHSVRQIAEQIDPVGQMIEGYVRPNGLRLEKVRVPLGVVMVIYESRPNVTSDAAALAIKSGNAIILRGGKEAIYSNLAIGQVIREAVETQGVDPNIVQVVETPDRAVVGALLKMEGRIDVVIPRGGEGLIRAVVEQSRIPVVKHYTGNCHVYVDEHATDLPAGVARDIVVNAKTQRPGVCNAAETFLFHQAAGDLAVECCRALTEAGVELRACPRTLDLLKGKVDEAKLKPAADEDWTTEYLDLICAVKIVESLEGAVHHINRYGSRHTDAILTAAAWAADTFVARVDSADVMVNCSTRFSDGGEYGLGAEIGISTDKLHARGPMGAADLTTYKWVVRGHGQIRT